MFILIKDNTKILPYVLDRNIEYKGIHIYNHNNNYYIELKNGYYFIDNEKIKILEVTKYEIKYENAYYPIHIYVYDNDDGYNTFKLYKNTNFVIANNTKANIVSLDKYTNECYLVYKEGTLESNIDILVNHHKYNGNKLKQADLIEFIGIKIIYFDEFLYINSFNNINKLLLFKNNGHRIKYNNYKNKDTYYIPKDICEFEIEELKDYILPAKPNNLDFIKSIIPNFIMCIAMCAMALMNYYSSSKNAETNILSFIVMPISMLITSILVPLLFTLISNKEYKKTCNRIKREYLNYLQEYKDDLNRKVSNYIDSLNSRFFNVIDNNKMMFYAGRNTDEFLKLSIGHITISKHIKVKKTNDKEIDVFLKWIEKIANNIDNYPLYLNIKDNKRITIISKDIEKRYFFNLFLLETAYKHHYEDINIALYSKDVSIFDDMFNLPHLFIYNKRLIINTDEQLQELNQLKLNKPLILFAYDECDFLFTNDYIYVIYFSNNLTNLYKDSNAIADFTNTKGTLYIDSKQEFKYTFKDIDFKKYYEYLGKLNSFEQKNIKYTFPDVYKKRIKEYYSNNNHSLKATFAFNKNELISLDLHESKQGPHGLIGGSTGSGKSELIISLLLSLCIRYSPEYLNIVLIDYKGGGLKESLTYNGKTIPHVIASVSNLENNTLERLIIALHNECKRRQQLFKLLSKYSNNSIMNLDDYLDNNLYDLENVSHLLIVVDEFAELKKENPEQIKELISISRIGRSLGVHLILATQKPTGVIDDEIWSNSRFKIALKVFDEKDSTDIIKCKDAAYLSNPGSFIMHIDGSVIKAQSMYAKSDINGNDSYKVSLLNSELQIEKTYKKNRGKTLSAAMYFSKQIIDSSECYKNYELDYLPPIQKQKNLLAKGNCLVIGEVDDYINSKKELLACDIKESLLIYSSRKYEINAILNTLNENRRHSIVIGSKLYSGSYISDSILYDDDEDIEYLLNTLYKNKHNNLTIVVEDISSLLSYDERYSEIFYKLIKRRESLDIGLIFITTTAQINYKIINSFKNKVMININDYIDLSTFYGTRSEYKGSSYYFDEIPKTFVPIKIEKYFEANQLIPQIIKRIPEYIKADTNNNEILLGYSEETKEPIYSSKNICITSLDQELLNVYLNVYSDINVCLYSYNSKFDERLPILWLGPGIFNQRLFITGRKEDININQGILINNSRTILIRRINNV